MSRLLESVDQCFKSVNIRSEPDTIPNVTLKHEASLGLALRLKRIFDATASGNDTTVVSVAFEDVLNEIVTEGDLRRAYVKDACPFIQPIIGAQKVDQSSDLPVVIGRLYRGKRRITVSYTDTAEARAKVETLVGQLGEAGFDANAKVGLERGLVVIDKERVPLAYAPAFIPARTSGIKLGGDPNQTVTYEWTAFQPSVFPSHTEVLSDLARARDPNPVWDDVPR
jgi:hypothetical protein